MCINCSFLANVNSCSRSLYAIARPSVCLSSVVCLSVPFMRPTQAFQIFGNISTALGTLAIRWHPLKISRRWSQGNPSAGELNTRGVGKYSDFALIDGYISETVQDTRYVTLITNRKSYMSFRLVPKSVTLNDLERRNGRYLALFHRIRVASGAWLKIFLYFKNWKRLSVCAFNPLPSDRLRCCDRYIRCQRSLAVKPLKCA